MSPYQTQGPSWSESLFLDFYLFILKVDILQLVPVKHTVLQNR